MLAYNIFLGGVGGQGIGLLCEILLRAADHAGLAAKAVDTHGLAQRGGTVVSHIRLGEAVFSPLIGDGEAHLVAALERHEAMRGLRTALRDGGDLVYYDASLQPLGVRLGREDEVTAADIDRLAGPRGIRVHRVKERVLPDPRMQNMLVLAEILGHGIIPGIGAGHVLQAMEDLLAGAALAANVRLFHEQAGLDGAGN